MTKAQRIDFEALARFEDRLHEGKLDPPDGWEDRFLKSVGPNRAGMSEPTVPLFRLGGSRVRQIDGVLLDGRRWWKPRPRWPKLKRFLRFLGLSAVIHVIAAILVLIWG
jgi:hypothetical protein